MNPHSPAHPTSHGDVRNHCNSGGVEGGLSIRAHIATQILAGICASSLYQNISYDRAADEAVQQADALIERLNKP